MSKLNVRNGTPVGHAHLCKRCEWGQFITGFRESDQLVICTRTDPNIAVPFTVFDCSEFSDKLKPTFEQMTKLAIVVDPARVSQRTRGFQPLTRIAPARIDEDEDEGEAARAR
jgi:hypothetical protein